MDKDTRKRLSKIRSQLRNMHSQVNIIGLDCSQWRLEAECGVTGTERNASVTLIMRGPNEPYHGHKPRPDHYRMGGHMPIQDVVALRDYLSLVIEMVALECPICAAAHIKKETEAG